MDALRRGTGGIDAHRGRPQHAPLGGIGPLRTPAASPRVAPSAGVAGGALPGRLAGEGNALPRREGRLRGVPRRPPPVLEPQAVRARLEPGDAHHRLAGVVEGRVVPVGRPVRGATPIGLFHLSGEVLLVESQSVLPTGHDLMTPALLPSRRGFSFSQRHRSIRSSTAWLFSSPRRQARAWASATSARPGSPPPARSRRTRHW